MKRVEKGIKSYSDEHRVKIITSDEEFVKFVKEANGELVSQPIWTRFIYRLWIIKTIFYDYIILILIVLNSSQVILFFGCQWSEPVHMMREHYAEYSMDYENAVFLEVDVDQIDSQHRKKHPGILYLISTQSTISR